MRFGATLLLLFVTEAAVALPRPTYILTPAGPEQLTREAQDGRRILFVNGKGGTYIRGENNALNNTSPIVRTASGMGTIPPAQLTESDWHDLMTCIRLLYGRFNIEVTDVDPGPVAHMEAVVGGHDFDVGVAGAGGISMLACGRVIETGISFTFSATYGNNVQTICEVIAQESAHTVGLEHEMLCDDPMTYLAACGKKQFQDNAGPCGEFEPRGCDCGGLYQNSFQLLLERLGPAERNAPMVSITAPAPGAEVQPGFVVEADATDDYVVINVELWADGSQVGSDRTTPFAITAPLSLPPGPHMLEVRAYDPAGNVGTATANVTVMGGCTGAADCAAGETCSQGVCLVELGERCDLHNECASGLCAGDPEDRKRCTQSCEAGASCPDGFACIEGVAGASAKCFPKTEDGGGCTVGRRRRAGILGPALWGLALVCLGACRPARRPAPHRGPSRTLAG